MAVIQKHQEPPLHLPHGNGGGDKKLRQANQKQRVEYWRELLAYIDAAYRKRFRRHYPWNNLARKNLWHLARVHSSWRAMACWDLFLESESWWAQRTGWSVYGMIRDMGRLMDDARFKPLANEHEEQLAKRRCGKTTKSDNTFDSLFKTNACELIARPCLFSSTND